MRRTAVLALVAFVRAAPLLNTRQASAVTSSAGSSDWTTYTLDGISFLSPMEVPSQSVSSAQASQQIAMSGRRGLLPATVMLSNASTIDSSVINTTLATYATDDVWQAAHLPLVWMVGASGSATLTSDACALLLSQGASFVLTSGIADVSACTCLPHASVDYPSSAVVPGPYLASLAGNSSVDLLPSYRLYADEYNTFLSGIYPVNDSWQAFEVSQQQDYMIPVPSRLNCLNDTRPLACLRFAVKDLYNLKGTVTTGGDKQFGQTFGIQNSTGSALQRLLDLGAIPVGKAKTSEFASGEMGNNWQWYTYPLNARGDGFLTCSASSAGPACAVGAYDWLDFAIGTDTGESVRRPAAVNGLYGNRPTQYMLPLDGVIPVSPYEDTAGIMTRSPALFQRILREWYRATNLTLPDSKSFPKRVFFPTDLFAGITNDALALVDAFLGRLETDFGMQRQDLNFSEYIYQQNASFSNGNTLLTEQNSTQAQYLNTYVERFGQLNGGRFPSFDSTIRQQEDIYYASNGAEDWNATQYAAALAPKNDLINFIESEVFRADNESCSDTLMVADIGYGGRPYWREDDLNTFFVTEFYPQTFNDVWLVEGALTPAMAAPDYVVPLGSIKYNSTVSQHEEELPVTINLISRPSCDFMILNLIGTLADSGVLKEVKTGRTLF